MEAQNQQQVALQMATGSELRDNGGRVYALLCIIIAMFDLLQLACSA